MRPGKGLRFGGLGAQKAHKGSGVGFTVEGAWARSGGVEPELAPDSPDIYPHYSSYTHSPTHLRHK